MPRTIYPKDRFDDLTADDGRVGAHRAENPRVRGGIVLLWSVVATVVLIVVGIFGALLATGRISLAPESTPTVAAPIVADPVVDTNYPVLVLNATGVHGLAGEMRDTIVTAGWAPEKVTDGTAGTDGFETTTIYYATAADEGAARGLAEVIGGAQIELTDAYPAMDDPSTPDVDESTIPQLVVVLGLDRAPAAP